jgi:hypothetical protein
MKAMVLNKICSLEENKAPLELANLKDPVPGDDEILVKSLSLWRLPYRAGQDRRKDFPAMPSSCSRP